MSITEAFKVCPEKFGEAWLSCLLTMVQGDISALTLKHAFIASKTGFLTALAFFVGSFVFKKNSVFKDVLLTGVFTAVADINVHQTHFGAWWTEAVVTGMGASFLALALHLIVTRQQRR